MARIAQVTSTSLLFCAMAPNLAIAEVCDKIALNWHPNEGPVGQFENVLIALQNPVAIGLLVLCALAFIFKNIWLPCLAAICVAGAGTGIIVVWFGRDGVMRDAISEGCRSSPELVLAMLAISFFALLHLAGRRALPLLFKDKDA